MRKILFAILLMLLTAEARATVWYVKKSGNDANNCTLSQDPATPKLTINSALACIGGTAGAGAGHTVEVWSGVYNERINSGVQQFPSGTSWNAPFTLQGKSGDTVTIRYTGFPSNLHLYASHNFYAIIQGLVFDGANMTQQDSAQISFGSSDQGGSYIRFQNNSVINSEILSGFLVGNLSNHVEILNNSIHDGAHVCSGGGGSFCYPIYFGASDSIISGNEIYNFPSWGIHLNAGGPYPSRNIISKNKIHTYGSGDPNRAHAIVINNGDDNRLFNNEIYNSSAKGLGNGTYAYRNIWHNNSINGTVGVGLENDNATTVIRNNIVANVTSSTKISPVGTRSHNLCPTAGTGCDIVGTVGFTSSTDLTLTAGSAAVDAGTISIAPCPAPFSCTLSAIYNGSLPDIGAFESIPFASAAASTSSIIDITFGSAYAPLSTVASCANVTVRQNAVTQTCTGFSNNGNATYRWTCAACLSSGGGTIDIAITAGKFTDTILIGNTHNQPNFALGTTTVTNNIVGTTEVFTSRHFRQRTYARATTDTIGAAWIKGEDLPGTVRSDSGKFANFWLIDCTIANCPSVGFQFEFQLNGGAWTAMTDSCATNAACFDSTNSAAPHGTVIPTVLLTDTLGNYLAGAVAAQANSYPVLDLGLNQSTQIQGNFAIKSGLVAGTDQICIRPKLDSGAAMTHAQTACINVVNPAGSPA